MFSCQRPVPPLLPLPDLGEDEGHDQQPEDDGEHAQGQREAQGAVDRVLAELAPVAQLAVAHQIGAAARSRYAGTVVVALNLSTGGQAVVDASRLGSRDEGGHRGGDSGREGHHRGGNGERVETLKCKERE